MTDTVKISELSTVSSVNDADYVPIVQGGVTKRATAAQMQRGTTFGKSLIAVSDDAAAKSLIDQTERFNGHPFDGIRFSTGDISSGDDVLTGYAFTASDAGKSILIEGAGSAGADLVTTIASVSGGNAVLTDNAGTTVTNAVVTFGTDATDLINEALTWAADNRRALRLPGGIAVVPNGGLVATGVMKIIGEGSGDAYGNGVTEISQFSKTATLLSVSGTGVTIEDIYFNCSRSDTASGTTSKGVHITGGSSHLSRCTAQNFGMGFSYTAINYSTMTGCRSLDCRVYGAYLTNTDNGDFGDMRITDCLFAGQRFNRLNTSAIRWESGGGLYVIGCKINGAQQSGNSQSWVNGIDLCIADNVYTQQIYIIGGSIEGINGGNCVKFSRGNPSGNGVLFRLDISHVEMHADGGGDTVNIDGGNKVDLGSGLVSFLSEVHVSDNTIGGSGYGVVIKGCTGATVHDNNLGTAYPGAFAGECHSYRWHSNILPPVNRDMFIDIVPEDSNSSGQFREGVLDFTYKLPTIASGGTATLWEITPKPLWKTVIVELDISGNVPTVGGTMWRGTIALNPTDDGSTFTAAVVGTPITSGASLTVALVVSRSNTAFKIQVTTPSGKTMYGETSIRISGPVKDVWALDQP